MSIQNTLKINLFSTKFSMHLKIMCIDKSLFYAHFVSVSVSSTKYKMFQNPYYFEQLTFLTLKSEIQI